MGFHVNAGEGRLSCLDFMAVCCDVLGLVDFRRPLVILQVFLGMSWVVMWGVYSGLFGCT